jgi:hypothetical protein
VRIMCRVMCVSSSAYYAWAERPSQLISANTLHFHRRAKKLFNDSRQSLGCRELMKKLREEGFIVGRNKARRLMKTLGLAVTQRLAYKVTTKRKYSDKVAAEYLCSLYLDKYDLQIVIARCFAFVGQDLPLTAHFAMGNFIHDALYGTEINLRGDGTPLRSCMNQADLAQWLLCIFDEGLTGNAYNVGSDQAISISALAYLVRDILSPHKPVVFGHTENGFQGRNVYIPDINRAKTELNLKLTIPLYKSIEEFLRK